MSNMIYKKMSDVMKDVGAIGKDQKNTQQGFKFRGIDQFVNALYPKSYHCSFCFQSYSYNKVINFF